MSGVSSPPPVEPATVADAAVVVALRESLTGWLQARGVDQWDHGEWAVEHVAALARDRTLYVCRDAEHIAGCVVLSWQDLVVWGERPPDAGYLHGLLVDRSYAGRGLGHALIGWAGQQTLAAERSILRLDCVATNPWLRGYYTDLGFTEVGRRAYQQAALRQSVLLEKQLR